MMFILFDPHQLLHVFALLGGKSSSPIGHQMSPPLQRAALSCRAWADGHVMYADAVVGVSALSAPCDRVSQSSRRWAWPPPTGRGRGGGGPTARVGALLSATLTGLPLPLPPLVAAPFESKRIFPRRSDSSELGSARRTLAEAVELRVIRRGRPTIKLSICNSVAVHPD